MDILFISNQSFLLNFHRGTIVVTTDKGENWIESVPDSAYYNSGAYMSYHLNDTTYLFHYHLLLKSSDNFKTWQSFENPFEKADSISIGRMHLTKDGYFIAYLYDWINDHRYHASLNLYDGNYQLIETPPHMTQSYFINKDVGWCFRRFNFFEFNPDTLNYQLIYKTINGGKDWFKQMDTTILQCEFTDMNFLNDKIGFAIAINSLILNTEDGGENWRILFEVNENDKPFGTIYKIVTFDENTALFRSSTKVFLLQRNPSGVFEMIPEFGSKNQSYLARRGGEIHLQNLEILNSPALHTIMGAEVENNLHFNIGKNASVITLPSDISCGLYFIHLDTSEGRQFIQVLIQD
ncbi:MAG: hypothetical protein IAE98_09810 [Candidatus Kapabacteria bacterium]|nr:hypothetical protein [Candidatus Kapabacteria bacterium]